MITFENIREHTVPLNETKWAQYWFKNEDGVFEELSPEHSDQICVLNEEASIFLWENTEKFKWDLTDKFFRKIEEFRITMDPKPTRKKLHEFGIPYDHWVYFPQGNKQGVVLTWKMVIKYCHNFDFDDNWFFDLSFNWLVFFHHEGELYLCKDYIYDGQEKTLKDKQIITAAFGKDHPLAQ